MKRKIIFFAMFVYAFFAGYGQESSLSEATSYYNNNDYINAKSAYLKALKEGNYNGEALYRFAYTNEMLDGLNGKVLDLYALAYFYLSNDGSNDQYLEWSKNKLNNNSYAIDSITTEKANGTIAKLIEMPSIDGALDGSLLRKFVKPAMISKLSDIMVVLVIIALIIYSTAIILSKKTNCVIIWGWWDLLLVAIPGLYLFIILLK
jgi:hypothetical protein